MKALEVGCTVLIIQRDGDDTGMWGAATDARVVALADGGWALVRRCWWQRAVWLPVDGPFTKLLRVEKAA